MVKRQLSGAGSMADGDGKWFEVIGKKRGMEVV
jgi:hypothetical protein